MLGYYIDFDVLLITLIPSDVNYTDNVCLNILFLMNSVNDSFNEESIISVQVWKYWSLKCDTFICEISSEGETLITSRHEMMYLTFIKS